jgi:hypothetical protein
MAHIVKVNVELRASLVLEFMRFRLADAEMKAAMAQVDRLIQKLDTDGKLAEAIRSAGALSHQHRESNLKMQALVAAAQEESGQDLSGYTLDSETGTFSSHEPEKAVSMAIVPPLKKAVVRPVKKPTKKTKKK